MKKMKNVFIEVIAWAIIFLFITFIYKLLN
jgi:hypothetical protein